ncbi:hypothetical protein NEAUS03_1360 [Nematocida ausubeli]|nr:hypothetical protein NEAUS03_1360 [Nematocida ausubeli]
MEELVSLKFIKEEKTLGRDNLAVEGIFMDRIILANKSMGEISLISLRTHEIVKIQGYFAGAYNCSLWVQNSHMDLIEYKWSDGKIIKNQRVEINDHSRVISDRIFVMKENRLRVYDISMQEILSVKAVDYFLSNTHILIRKDHEVVLYKMEDLTEIRRVPVRNEECFLVDGIIMIIHQGHVRIIQETEIHINISIDIDEDQEIDVYPEGTTEKSHYRIAYGRNIGPLDYLIVISHMQSVDVEYIAIQQETIKKWQLEEEADGISVPLMQHVVGMHVLESSVLQDYNMEDREIVQGPSIALETNSTVYVYDIMAEVSDPKKYAHTRRGPERKLKLQEIEISYKPEEKSPVPLALAQETHDDSAVKCEGSDEGEGSEGKGEIFSEDTKTLSEEAKAKTASEEALKVEETKPVVIAVEETNPTRILEEDNNPVVQETKPTRPVVEETSPVDALKVQETNTVLGMTNLLKKEETKPVVQETNSINPVKQETKPVVNMTNLLRPAVEDNNPVVQETNPVVNMTNNSKTEYTPNMSSIHSIPKEISPLSLSSLSSIVPGDESFLEYSIRKTKDAEPETTAHMPVAVDIPDRNSPMDEIHNMIMGLDLSVRNPIASVKEHTQEIREVVARCKSILETVEVTKTPGNMHVKGLLSGIEEALILLKDQEIRLKEEILERQNSTEKAQALTFLIDGRLSRIKKLLSLPSIDFSKEIDYINTRISRLFNISTYTTGKSKDQISPNTVTTYNRPLKLAVDQIHTIEESTVLPASRETTLSLLTECFDKLHTAPACVQSAAEVPLLDRIFSTEAEQAFLKTLQERAKKAADAKKAEVNKVGGSQSSQSNLVRQSSQISQSSQTRGLFSSQNTLGGQISQSNTTSSNSLFGRQNTQGGQSGQISQPTSLFSGQSSQISQSGQSSQSNSNSLFSGQSGQSTTSQTGQTGGIFGSQNSQPSIAQAQISQNTQYTSNILFSGQNTQPSTAQPTSLFGNQNTQNTQPTTTSQSTSQPTTSLFGNSQNNLGGQSGQPTTSLFGNSQNGQNSQNPLGVQPSLSGGSGIPLQTLSEMGGSSIFGGSGTPTGSIFNNSSLGNSQPGNSSFSLLQRQGPGGSQFAQGNANLGLGSSSKTTSSLFRNPNNQQ